MRKAFLEKNKNRSVIFMKKRLAVLVAMGTLAAFSLGVEAKTYAVEDEDGSTKYITVYNGKVETTTEEDEAFQTEASDLYEWEEGEAVDDETSDAYVMSESTYVTGDEEGTMDEEEFFKAEQKRIAEYEKLGIQYNKDGLYTWKGDSVNVIMDDDGSFSTWSSQDSSKAERVYLHIVRDKDGKATDVEAVTARVVLEKMLEQDLRADSDKE